MGKNIQNEHFRVFKDMHQTRQSNSILMTPTSNVELKSPNAPKKVVVIASDDDSDAIPECLHFDEDHVPFQLDHSNSNRLLSLKNKGCSETSTPLDISEHFLVPDLDD